MKIPIQISLVSVSMAKLEESSNFLDYTSYILLIPSSVKPSKLQHGKTWEKVPTSADPPPILGSLKLQMVLNFEPSFLYTNSKKYISEFGSACLVSDSGHKHQVIKF